MPKCKIAVIRTGLGVSDTEFVKIRRTVQDEVQREGLETKFLGTAQMRKTLDEMVERIRTKFEQHFTLTDRNRVGEGLLRLIHVEKANISQRVAVTKKQRPTRKLKPAMAQKEALEVDQHDSPTMAIDSPTTPTIPQTYHTGPQNNDEHVRNSAIIIRLEADLSKKFIINLGFILTGNPDPKDKGGNLLYKASYDKLLQSLRGDTFLTADSGDKLWGFVPGGGLASGWWRIRADSSLRACLHAQQQACSDHTGQFLYVINQGSSYFIFASF